MKAVIWSLTLLFALCFVASSQAEPPSFESLKERYLQDHPGKGKYGKHWQPIPIQRYWNPKDFYQPPGSVKGEFTRQQCVECHQNVTPGFVHAWKNSTHANLKRLRTLSKNDVRAYKKQILAQVETNLVSQGILRQGEHLQEVNCIDCHGGVGKQKIRHDIDLKLPDRTACGTCHVEQFAQAESEKAQTWPQNQWPKGHPSHAMDWKANVETAVWAGMAEREIAQGCDMCHYQQNKCDGCHTRHSFSAAEARQPEACATCHNGVDHNEFENYLLSKHGTVYQTHKSQWNFEAPLKEAFTRGGYTAPTCQLCHFEYRGEYSHNLVRKVRWGFNPTPEIADNLNHSWFEARKAAWIGTCSQCHSPRFAKTYLETADQGILQGLKVEQEAKKVIQALYDDGLLVGQKTNRPAPPAPVKDAPGGFFQLFWAKGNNPSHVERVYADMWEHDLIKLYKGLVHANPGGFTYSEGWSPLLADYSEIMDENTHLREQARQQTSGLKELLNTANLSLEPMQFPLGMVLVAGGLMILGRKRKP
ncbi:MAG: hydroxylamine reductase [Methylothermaceae bacteria B42]|nr:MAG: hydroxylamine reductase [Methylothermaceae bacteria B42]HHJ40369.1 hydroxylamine reductase [Methylothermaceae bacterium]